MSQIVGSDQTGKSALRHLYAPIELELAQVEEVLHEELQSDHGYVDELVRYGCLLGGKRLRPVLLLLSAKALGRVTRDHVILAAAVEMIHTATLIHDDVLDEAQTRRHLATVNSRWDTKTSVLLGDYLFTHAFFLASKLDATLACQVIGRATNIVCEGELRQKGARGDFSLSESEYLDIIAAKTAELCACSCFLGAHFATGNDVLSDRLAAFGRDLGIAFQIVDDVLDLQGDENSMGKSLGTDLAQQKATLPVIRSLELADESDREQILAILNGESGEREAAIAPLLQQFDAFGYSYDVARQLARRATARLADLPSSAARQALYRLGEFVVARSR